MANLLKPIQRCLTLAKQVPKIKTNLRYLSSAPSDPKKTGDHKVVDAADPKGSCK